MKLREFWIKWVPGHDYGYDYWETECSRDPKCINAKDFVHSTHVREIIPIDWEKVWNDFAEEFPMIHRKIHCELIQRLVEKQLRGEE